MLINLICLRRAGPPRLTGCSCGCPVAEAGPGFSHTLLLVSTIFLRSHIASPIPSTNKQTPIK